MDIVTTVIVTHLHYIDTGDATFCLIIPIAVYFFPKIKLCISYCEKLTGIIFMYGNMRSGVAVMLKSLVGVPL